MWRASWLQCRIISFGFRGAREKLWVLVFNFSSSLSSEPVRSECRSSYSCLTKLSYSHSTFRVIGGAAAFAPTHVLPLLHGARSSPALSVLACASNKNEWGPLTLSRRAVVGLASVYLSFAFALFLFLSLFLCLSLVLSFSLSHSFSLSLSLSLCTSAYKCKCVCPCVQAACNYSISAVSLTRAFSVSLSVSLSLPFPSPFPLFLPLPLPLPREWLYK